ncbi:MAG: hypothetical protein HY869_17550 [Chloroflexi bacterium]|nr:hypothetical protein [Chloroflexota bacterium]
MNLRPALFLLVILGLLTGCVPVTSIPITGTTTTTTPIVTTHIAVPTRPETAIPMSPSPSSTPLPGTPTVTPTFDPSMIVTVTPAQAAVCPKENPSLVADFPIQTNCMEKGCILGNAEKFIQDYLNAGGSMQSTLERLRQNFSFDSSDPFFYYTDLTNDGIPELIFEDFGISSRVHILYCEMGSYKVYPSESEIDPYDISWYSLQRIQDVNANGLQDVIIVSRGCSGSGCYGITVLEWDGMEFVQLAPSMGMTGLLNFKITDQDHNGLSEFRLHGGLYSQLFAYEYPVRNFIETYDWNGHTFEPTGFRYDPPVFRFQAIQDADQLMLQNQYQDALALYQDAVFNDQLEGWSKKRADFTQQLLYTLHGPDTLHWPDFKAPEFAEDPIDSSLEYNSLAAYSYYRITLLHILQGHESDAGTVYQTLQQKFTEGNPGYIYAEMAAAFWNEYQSSHDMTAACGMAVDYAAAHPDILIPLGSDYHGMQSHTYKPEDVCPFR